MLVLTKENAVFSDSEISLFPRCQKLEYFFEAPFVMSPPVPLIEVALIKHLELV